MWRNISNIKKIDTKLIDKGVALRSYFEDKRILITGGLGFLGSNLAHKLVNLGSEVTVIDNLNPRYGGNIFNISGIEKKVNLIINDIRNIEAINAYLANADVIYHFAAQVSYIDALDIPLEDQDLNAKSTLLLLEFLRKNNPSCKVIFSSSRMVLGKVEGELMKETSPTNPLSLYGIHKLTSEKYLQMYYKDFAIPSVILRITNPYGIRQQIKHNKYSLVGWFIRQAMENKDITIFGEGNQLRDYIYVDDMVEGFLRVAESDNAFGEIINLGSGVSTKFVDMVRTIINVVESGSIKFVPWPSNYENIETGDIKTDLSKLEKITGFTPSVSLEEGILKTYQYYKNNIKYYL